MSAPGIPKPEKISVKAFFDRYPTGQLALHPQQRPYVWSTAMVGQFLSSLRERADAGAFIGTVVTVEKEDRLYILDGQQRLNTLSLLAQREVVSRDIESRVNVRRILKTGIIQSFQDTVHLENVFFSFIKLPDSLENDYLDVAYGEVESHLSPMGAGDRLKSYHFLKVLEDRDAEAGKQSVEPVLERLNRRWMAGFEAGGRTIGYAEFISKKNSNLNSSTWPEYWSFVSILQLALVSPALIRDKNRFFYYRYPLENNRGMSGNDPLSRFYGRKSRRDWSHAERVPLFDPERPLEFRRGLPFFFSLNVYRRLYQVYTLDYLTMSDDKRASQSFLKGWTEDGDGLRYGEMSRLWARFRSSAIRYKKRENGIPVIVTLGKLFKPNGIFLFALFLKCFRRFDMRAADEEQLIELLLWMKADMLIAGGWVDKQIEKSHFCDLSDWIDFADDMDDLMLTFKANLAASLDKHYPEAQLEIAARERNDHDRPY